MKSITKFISIIVLAATATVSSCSVAHAGAINHASPASTKQFCTDASEVAEVTMKARQAGVPIQKMMELAGDNPLWESYVELAWEAPQYSTESYQNKAVREFASQAYLLCIKAMKNVKNNNSNNSKQKML